MSVNETAMQNVWQHHFLQPGGGDDARLSPGGQFTDNLGG
jgi:hypothetical protein